MTIRQFIQKARLGGAEIESDLYYENNPAVAAIFLMPEAWKAVAKVEGWFDAKTEAFMVGLMLDLFAGKTIEDYLATL